MPRVQPVGMCIELSKFREATDTLRTAIACRKRFAAQWRTLCSMLSSRTAQACEARIAEGHSRLEPADSVVVAPTAAIWGKSGVQGGGGEPPGRVDSRPWLTLGPARGSAKSGRTRDRIDLDRCPPESRIGPPRDRCSALRQPGLAQPFGDAGGEFGRHCLDYIAHHDSDGRLGNCLTQALQAFARRFAPAKIAAQA
jgi:hypothetical protein